MGRGGIPLAEAGQELLEGLQVGSRQSMLFDAPLPVFKETRNPLDGPLARESDNSADQAIRDLRATGLALFERLLELAPVPHEVKSRATEGRKIADRYEEKWFSVIRKNLSTNNHNACFLYEEEIVQVKIKGERDLFDVVLWYKDTPYTGNFKVTKENGNDNVFGTGGFSYLLSAPQMTRTATGDVTMDLLKEDALAQEVSAVRQGLKPLPEPREYFLISHHRVTKQDRVIPVTAMTSHLSAPKSNTLQGIAHKANININRPWKESWEAMADLLAGHAAKRATLHLALEYGSERHCATCNVSRWGQGFCHVCGSILTAQLELDTTSE